MFGSGADAMSATGADVSVIFVPAPFTKLAVVETVDAAIPLAVVITEGVAVRDTAEFFTYAEQAGATRVIGPNCPGLITPDRSTTGIIPADIYAAANVKERVTKPVVGNVAGFTGPEARRRVKRSSRGPWTPRRRNGPTRHHGGACRRRRGRATVLATTAPRRGPVPRVGRG